MIGKEASKDGADGKPLAGMAKGQGLLRLLGVITSVVIRSSLGQLTKYPLHPGQLGVGTDITVLDGYQTARDAKE